METVKLNIKQWAEDDRPREKLMRKGAAALSNAELLAILIGSGNVDESAVELMKRLLADCDNRLKALGRMSLEELTGTVETEDGNTGKPVAECSADELISIGFWFPQAFNGQTIYEETDKSEWIFSVADIEEMIGGEFSFFPTVPEEVKHQRNLADWGL